MLKKQRFVLAFLLLAIFASGLDRGVLAAAGNGTKSPAPAETLAGIETRISAAQRQAFAHGDFSTLDQIAKEIESLDVPPQSTLSYYKNYWHAYLLYIRSLALMRQGHLEESETSLRAAIDVLKETEPKDAEVLALLALASGLHMRFEPPQRIPTMGALVGKYTTDALKADPENVRALYVNAISDWHTPRQYGGGKQAEKLARHCIEQPQEEMGKGLAPKWGRDLCLALLIEIQLQKGALDEAHTLIAQGKQEYPFNPIFAELEKRLPPEQR